MGSPISGLLSLSGEYYPLRNILATAGNSSHTIGGLPHIRLNTLHLFRSENMAWLDINMCFLIYETLTLQ